MPSRYSRPMVSRARRRAMNRRRLIIGGGALAALVVVLLVTLLIPKGGGPDRAVEALGPAGTPEPTPQAEAQVEDEPGEEEDDGVPEGSGEGDVQAPDEAAQPAAAPTPDPGSAEVMARRAQTRPTPTAEGFMPVFSKADTDEKIIAITVDDCFQANNLQQIVDKAIECDAKLTIFPIGKNVIRSPHKKILKYAWENGMELENHTMTHSGLYNVTAEKLAEQVYMQQMALSYILDLEYQCHFLRPRGGDARKDQRMQMYAKQLGYYGIAHWSADGKYDDKKLAKNLKPGAIYLFHTTNSDLEKLLRFIPWVKEQGYQMVTLNEMFGYPANETSALTTPVSEHVIPPLEPYEMVYVPLKATTYSWEAHLLQERLIQMGYLEGEADGVFGPGCEKAVAKYQQDHGLEVTGVADADLVRTILESGEPASASSATSAAATTVGDSAAASTDEVEADEETEAEADADEEADS